MTSGLAASYVRQKFVAPLSFNDGPQRSMKELVVAQKFAQNHKFSAKSLHKMPKMEVSQYAGWCGASWCRLSTSTAAQDDGATKQGEVVAEFQVLILWLNMVKVGSFMIVWKMLRQMGPHSKIRHIAEKVW